MTIRHTITENSGRLLVLTAALLMTSVNPPAQQPKAAQAELVLEPRSGLSFPVDLAVPARPQFHRLAGTGIRTKTIFRVQVYAFGLYLDAAVAPLSLAGWRGRAARELERDEAFYGKLLEDGLGKSLRIVMTRTVGGKDMMSAFEDALTPRLTQAIEKLSLSGTMADLERFRSYFNVKELTEGTELVFAWLAGGTLVTAIQGEVKGEIQSPALCRALFDIYLGRKPISKGAKKTIIARIPSILAPRE